MKQSNTLFDLNKKRKKGKLRASEGAKKERKGSGLNIQRRKMEHKRNKESVEKLKALSFIPFLRNHCAQFKVTLFSLRQNASEWAKMNKKSPAVSVKILYK